MALSRNDAKSTLSKDYGVFATHNPIRIRYTHLVSILMSAANAGSSATHCEA